MLKYRKHSTRDVGFVEHNGKRHYLPGEYGSEESRLAYQQFVSELKPRAKRPVVTERMPRPPQSQCTVSTICIAFCEYAINHYQTRAAGTDEFQACRATAEKLIRFCGTLPANRFGPLKLKAFRNSLVAETRPPKKGSTEERRLSRRYINSHINRVRRFFRWAASEELCSHEVWVALKTVDGLREGRTAAVELPKRQPVSWEQIEATLPGLSEDLQRAVTLQWLTATRSQSIVNATASQFDLDAKIWRPTHKNEFRGQELLIPLGDKAVAIVKEQLDASNGLEYLFSPIRVGRRRNIRYGIKYSAYTYRQAVTRAQEKCNVSPRWTPHQIRHGRATQVRHEYGLEAAQAVLGHASIDATQIYASRLLELARKVADETG